MSVFGGGMDFGPRGDKGLSIGLMQLLKMAWADPDLRQRIIFVLAMFGVFVLGVHIPVPIAGVRPNDLYDRMMKDNGFFQLLNSFGGGALKRVSIFSLGLSPYISSSIILQILTQALPEWKKELKEGGEYARRQQNRRTRALTLVLCLGQSLALLQAMATFFPEIGNWAVKLPVAIFWTAGSMFQLYLGEQISEKGIGNGISMMIFAGIAVSLPQQFATISQGLRNGTVAIWSVVGLLIAFVATTWFIVLFTTAQRRIPIQHMRRQVGNRSLGGQVSYLPISLSTAGVIPIIFAVTFLFLPRQFAGFFHGIPAVQDFFMNLAEWLSPIGANGKWITGSIFYAFLIFAFSYFYTAIQLNVEDMADHLKRAGSFIPGVRPGKQTKDFLDGVISRITVVGACFLTVVALTQYWVPSLLGIQNMSVIGGTTLLIIVSVALETMRQIEANILMKQYGN